MYTEIILLKLHLVAKTCCFTVVLCLKKGCIILVSEEQAIKRERERERMSERENLHMTITVVHVCSFPMCVTIYLNLFVDRAQAITVPLYHR